MSNTISPNMSLLIPTVGNEAGPQYATDINNSLTILDSHNHSLGSGVQITPAGLNISSALTFLNNPATNLSFASFDLQTSVSAAQSLYVQYGSESTPVGDLWYNNSNGYPIQLTSGTSIVAGTATIPGESYNAGTFTWKQGAGSTMPANFDIGSITIRPNVSGTTAGIQLEPYSGIASSIPLVLPALPASPNTNFLTLDYNGNMVASTLYPLTSSGIAANTILSSNIAPATIVSSNIAPATIVSSNIASGTITGSNIAANTITTSNVAYSSPGINPGQLDSTSGFNPGGYFAFATTGTGTVNVNIQTTQVTPVPAFNLTLGNVNNLRPIFVQFTGTISDSNSTLQEVTWFIVGKLPGSGPGHNTPFTIATYTIFPGINYALPASLLNTIVLNPNIFSNGVFPNIYLQASTSPSGPYTIQFQNVTMSVFQV